MVAAAKAAVPTVTDQAAALQLGNFAKATGVALADLRAASARVGVVWACVVCVWVCACTLKLATVHLMAGYFRNFS